MDNLVTSFEQAALPPVRPMLAGGRPAASAAFDGYLRGGVETKALSGASGAEGGYAVPREIDAQIDVTLQAISPIRAIANVVKVGTSGYRKLVASGGFDSGWTSETAARPITATPTFNEVAPPFGELYANPAASQAMLDDAMFDVEAWLAGKSPANSPSPRARRSSAAPASTSPRASSPRRPRPRRTPRAPSARCNIWRPAQRAPLPPIRRRS